MADDPLEQLDEKPQFLPVITTNGMVNIEIQNSHGNLDLFLYVEELRQVLNDYSKTFPPENCVPLRRPLS